MTTGAQQPKAVARGGVRGSPLYLKLVFVYMLVVPFYLWQSGLPQISDMWMVLVVLSVGPKGLRFLADRRYRSAFSWLAIFTGYVAVVSLGWFVLHPSRDFLMPPLYYVFSLLIFGSALGASALYEEAFVRYLSYGAVASVVIQTLMSPFKLGNNGPREVLFFNNPNQLGYYSLITAAIIFLAYRARRLPLWACTVGAVCCLWLVALSLSKAAIVGIGILGVLTSVGNARIVILIASLLVSVVPADFVIVDNVEQRMRAVGQDNDDNWEGRGYNRIVEHPGYLILGAAEGGYERMNLPASQQHEIHSSLGTVLFSYGVVGLVVFCVFLVAVVRCSGGTLALYILPMMLYGMTHMGLREGLLWLFFAQLCCLGRLGAPARTQQKLAVSTLSSRSASLSAS